MGKPPNVLERTLLAANAAPPVLLDVNGAMTFRAVAQAAKRGLFAALREGAMTSDEAAKRLGLDRDATASWLGLLEAAGFVRRDGPRFANTPATAKWLLPGGPMNFGDFVRFWDEVVMPFWDAHLGDVLVDGKPPETLYEWMDRKPGAWELAQAWFLETARGTMPEVLPRVRLPEGAKRLLDLGGGHGYYSAALCKAHPQLKAEVLDGPAALRVAERVVKEQGVADRIRLREGDYMNAPLGEGYDAVLLFNVLHAHQQREVDRLLKRAAGALRRGGKVIILEQTSGSAPGPALETFLRMLDLNYRAVLGGRTYTFQELAASLEQAGLRGVVKRPLRKTPGNVVIEATKP